MNAQDKIAVKAAAIVIPTSIALGTAIGKVAQEVIEHVTPARVVGTLFINRRIDVSACTRKQAFGAHGIALASAYVGYKVGVFAGKCITKYIQKKMNEADDLTTA